RHRAEPTSRPAHDPGPTSQEHTVASPTRSQRLSPEETAERADRILEAAGLLLVSWGHRKVTIEDVARRAGVGKGTVYLHFPTKDSAVPRRHHAGPGRPGAGPSRRHGRTPRGDPAALTGPLPPPRNGTVTDPARAVHRRHRGPRHRRRHRGRRPHVAPSRTDEEHGVLLPPAGRRGPGTSRSVSTGTAPRLRIDHHRISLPSLASRTTGPEGARPTTTEPTTGRQRPANPGGAPLGTGTAQCLAEDHR